VNSKHSMEELVSRVTRVTKCQDCGAEVEQLSGPLEVCAQACKGCGYPRSVLPADVEALFEDAQRAARAQAYTAAALACRRLLTHATRKAWLHYRERHGLPVRQSLEFIVKHHLQVGGAMFPASMRDVTEGTDPIIVDEHEACLYLQLTAAVLRETYNRVQF
jgi:hypothetical protein